MPRSCATSSAGGCALVAPAIGDELAPDGASASASLLAAAAAAASAGVSWTCSKAASTAIAGEPARTSSAARCARSMRDGRDGIGTKSTSAASTYSASQPRSAALRSMLYGKRLRGAR